MSLIRLLPHRSEHSKDLWRCHCSSSSSGNLFWSPPNSPSGPEDWAKHQQSWNLRVRNCSISFLLCEVAVVAYLKNLLMMFPLISDHPLRERIQLVECNLKHNMLYYSDRRQWSKPRHTQFWPAHKTQICFSINRYCLLECNLKQNAIEADQQSLETLDTPNLD